MASEEKDTAEERARKAAEEWARSVLRACDVTMTDLSEHDRQLVQLVRALAGMRLMAAHRIELTDRKPWLDALLKVPAYGDMVDKAAAVRIVTACMEDRVPSRPNFAALARRCIRKLRRLEPAFGALEPAIVADLLSRYISSSGRGRPRKGEDRDGKLTAAGIVVELYRMIGHHTTIDAVLKAASRQK